VNATADYAAAAAQLNRPLPAYVSYVDRSSGGWGPLQGSRSTHVVVRTSDGHVISGSSPVIRIGADATTSDDVVTRPPFRPACYAPGVATLTEFDGRPAERIGLHTRCDKSDKDADFDSLYVDPVSHRPLAAIGNNADETTTVRIVQRFVAVDGYVLPAGIDVTVIGHGWMTWLNVAARVELSDYRFSATPP
jgi:hypothetical protein